MSEPSQGNDKFGGTTLKISEIREVRFISAGLETKANQHIMAALGLRAEAEFARNAFTP